jgi:hypothetical protein
MGRTRKLLPFIFPILMLSVTIAAYVIGRRDDSLPTEQAWDSASHSGGAWHGGMTTFIYFALIFGVLGGLSGLAVARQRGYASESKLWALGTLLGAGATVFVFWRFGYLID